jgi:hypothetical protein
MQSSYVVPRQVTQSGWQGVKIVKPELIDYILKLVIILFTNFIKITLNFNFIINKIFTFLFPIDNHWIKML